MAALTDSKEVRWDWSALAGGQETTPSGTSKLKLLAGAQRELVLLSGAVRPVPLSGRTEPRRGLPNAK